MKLTNSRLQQIILEETDAVLNEVEWWDKLKSKASDIGGKITGKDWKAGKQLTKRGRAMDPKSSTYAGVDPGTAKYLAGQASQEADSRRSTDAMDRAGRTPLPAAPKIDTNSPEYQKWAIGDKIQQSMAASEARAEEMAKDPTQSWMLPAEQERMRKGIGYHQVRRQGSRASGRGKFIPPDIYAHPTQLGKYLKYDPNIPERDVKYKGRGYYLARNRMEAGKTAHLDPYGQVRPDYDPSDTHADRAAKRQARYEADPVKYGKEMVYSLADDPLVNVMSLHPGVGAARSLVSMARTAQDPTVSDEERGATMAYKLGKEFLPAPAKTAAKAIRAIGGGDPGERAIASTFEKGGGGKRRYAPTDLAAIKDPMLPPEEQGRGRRPTAQARAAHQLQQSQAMAAHDPAGASGEAGLTNQQLASRNSFRLDLRGRGFDRNAIAGIERQATRLASVAGARGMPYSDALAMASQDAIRTRQRARATQVAATGDPASAADPGRSWPVREHKDSILTRLENLIKEETTTFLKKQS